MCLPEPRWWRPIRSCQTAVLMLWHEPDPMKALVLKEYKRLALEEVPKPEPGPEEVLIAVKACGICGSDVHGLDGSTGRRRPPIIMGHEAAGIVAKIGSNVKGLK